MVQLSACQIRQTFVKLRRDMVEFLGIDRRTVRPWTRLGDIVPLEKHETFWKYIASGGPLTEAGQATARTGFSEPTATPKVKAPPGRLNRFLEFLSRVCGEPKRRLSFEMSTVREVVLFLSADFLRRDRSRPWTSEEISTIVRIIVSENSGVPFDRIGPETSFLSDLE